MVGTFQTRLFHVNKHEFIIDTCSIISQKDSEPHRRCVYKTLWDKIDIMVRGQQIVICDAIKNEVNDKEILEWLNRNNCAVLPLTNAVQFSLSKVANAFSSKVMKQSNTSADEILVAIAMTEKLGVITEENKKNQNNIPAICKYFDVPCYNLTGFAESMQWVF